MSEEAILAALLQENATRCDPPLEEKEVRTIAHSIGRYAPASSSVSQEWDPPISFSSAKLPSFPTDVLPDWLRDFVKGEAQSTQTPVDLCAMLVLAAVATACAKKVAVMVRTGWIESLNLFIVAALLPGSRKTRVFSSVEEPIREFEEELSKDSAGGIAEAETKHRILQGKLQHLQGKASKAEGPEAEQFTREATAIAQELASNHIPPVPRLVADDVTPERLATMIKEQGGRMAILSAEGGVFDLMAGRYSKDGAPNFEVYLKSHAGDTLRVDRVGRPPEYVPHPALTLGLAVQPEVLAGLIRKQGFRGRGLLGRFCYALPVNLLGRRKIGAPPLLQSIQDSYKGNIRSLLSLPFSQDEEGNPMTQLLRLSAEASARFQHFEALVEPMLAEFGLLGHMTDWGGKLAGAVARIAGLLHMADYAGHDSPWDIRISLETVERAIQIGDYLIPHARAAYASMGADPAIEDAKRVLAWIRRKEMESFSKRHLFNEMRGYFKRVSQLEPVLAALEEHGYVRCKQPSRSGAGRKPSPLYEINPLWLAQDNSAHSAYFADTELDSRDGDGQGSGGYCAHSADIAYETPLDPSSTVKEDRSTTPNHPSAETLNEHTRNTQNEQNRSENKQDELFTSIYPGLFVSKGSEGSRSEK